MRHRRFVALAALAVAMAVPALAQAEDRYQLERTRDGYVRLDTQTGRMSLCQERGDQLVCRMASEEQAAYDRDLDALQDKVDALADRLAALESRQPAANLPSEEEFEQTLGYMERFFRRFMGIVGELDRSFRDDDGKEPMPGRT